MSSDESEYRVRIAAEVAQDIRRQLSLALGELRPQRPTVTLAEIAEEWWPIKAGTLPGSARQAENRLRKHVLPAFGRYSCGQLTKLEVRSWMLRLAERLSPQTVNHCRKLGGQLVEYAQDRDLWLGKNPFFDVDPLLVRSEVRDVLSPREAGALIRESAPPWGCAFALAILLGLRVGEIWGLRHSDVDMARGVLHVRRSHDRNRTKNGKHRTLPVPSALRPYLVVALSSVGPWLVTDTGRQLSRWRNAAEIARAWLANIGVRRAFDFHSLRHTSATLHLQAGCHPWVVSKVLGHSAPHLPPPPDITWRYAHFDDAWVRTELERLKL